MVSDVEQSRGRGKDGGAPKEKKSGVLSVVVVVGIVFFFLLNALCVLVFWG
jgi:flagellar basal body-associated protein FliL